jgi:hypothetical protein
MLKEDYTIVLTAQDEAIFAQLVPAAHYLRRLKQALDFEALRPLLTAAYEPVIGAWLRSGALAQVVFAAISLRALR